MHKKDSVELDIPVDDIDCWNKYPKYRWVYDVSRLLDMQNVKWSPFATDMLQTRIVNMQFKTTTEILHTPAYIYIESHTGTSLTTEVYVIKGEIKLLRHIDKSTQIETSDLIGNIELRINAFISMHFHKFTGVITIESVGNNIMSVRLMSDSNLVISTNIEISKLIKRIYKKNDVVHINGLADQLLHESLNS